MVTEKKMQLPIKGAIFTKNGLKRLNYNIVKDYFEFFVFELISKIDTNKCEIIDKFQKMNKECVKMTYNEFVNYLYSEGYIDDNNITININKNGN